MSFIFTRMSSITYRIVGHDKDLLHQVKKLNDTIFGGSSHEMRSLKRNNVGDLMMIWCPSLLLVGERRELWMEA